MHTIEPVSSRRWPRIWAVADAVGHCVLVFCFAPTVVELGLWLVFEVNNPLNRQDPIVLGFILVRGVNAFLDAFAVNVLPGVLAGTIAGCFVSGWVLYQGEVATTERRLLLGALGGAVAATVPLAVLPAARLYTAGYATTPAIAAVLQLVSGVACGLLSGPRAVALAGAAEALARVPAEDAAGDAA